MSNEKNRSVELVERRDRGNANAVQSAERARVWVEVAVGDGRGRKPLLLMIGSMCDLQAEKATSAIWILCIWLVGASDTALRLLARNGCRGGYDPR